MENGYSHRKGIRSKENCFQLDDRDSNLIEIKLGPANQNLVREFRNELDVFFFKCISH